MALKDLQGKYFKWYFNGVLQGEFRLSEEIESRLIPLRTDNGVPVFKAPNCKGLVELKDKDTGKTVLIMHGTM